MLLKIWDSLFSTQFSIHPIISHIQNTHVLCVPILTGLSLAYYAITSSTATLINTQRLIFWQCGFDMCLTRKPDIFIHHCITMGLIQFFFAKPLPLSEVHFQTAILLATELSSIFLVGREYLPTRHWYRPINDVLFLTTFGITRLYWLPKYLLLDASHNEFMMGLMTPGDKMWYYGCLYSFMFINIYWGSILLKMVTKRIKPYIPYYTLKNNEWLLQYTYFASPIICLWQYSPNPGLGVVDFFGNFVLSLNSFFFHNEIYNQLAVLKTSDDKPPEINVLDKSIYQKYLNDIVSIHIRSYLCVWVNLVTVEDFGHYFLGNLAIFHLIALYHFFQYILELKYDNERILLYVGKDSGMDLMARAPIFFDILVILYHNSDSVDETSQFAVFYGHFRRLVYSTLLRNESLCLAFVFVIPDLRHEWLQSFSFGTINTN